jgi:anti-repressor protein
MKEIQKFNFKGQDLAVKEIDGQVYFNAEQAAIGLGITSASNGYINVRWSRINNYLNSATSGRKISKGDFITEPQFYMLAIKANNPVAEKFQYWVTHEVLPSIRKHGAYMTDEKAFDVVHNASGLADLLQQAADQLKAKDIQIEEMKPKALFADSVVASHTTILIGELAKILRGNGINIGANRLFQWMRNQGYLISRKGTDYNLPTQRSMDLGLFKIKETTIMHSNGSISISKTTKVTGKGQQYFINKFMKMKEEETC